MAFSVLCAPRSRISLAAISGSPLQSSVSPGRARSASRPVPKLTRRPAPGSKQPDGATAVCSEAWRANTRSLASR